MRPGEVADKLDAAIDAAYRSGLLYAEATRFFKWRFLQRVLDANGGSQSRAARELGIHRNSLAREISIASEHGFKIRHQGSGVRWASRARKVPA